MEVASVSFTPLSGGVSEEPPCYLLDIGGFRLLLDCGWCDPYDPQLLEPLARVAKDVDAVLLSHGDVLHCGALPYAFSALRLSAPVYCTAPVQRLGQLALYDAWLSKRYNGDCDAFTADTIDAAFERAVPLKYSQHVTLEGKGAGIELTPYAAGHSLGGCVWRIKVGMEEILYCSHYNHTNERHLEKGILQTLQRPMLLICDASNALVEHRDKRADRDRQLVESVIATFRNGGNVLIPVDSAGRVLELCLFLDQYWQSQRLVQYSLVLLSTQAYNVTAAAATLLEWMSEHIAVAFQNATTEAPFALPTVHRCHSIDDLAKVPQPMLLLASMPDLESGFARELLAHWAPEKKNLVVMVDRNLPGTLARRLADGAPSEIPLNLSKRVVLQGEELVAYKRSQEIARLQELERIRLEDAKREMLEVREMDEGPEEETLAQPSTMLVVDVPYFQNNTRDLVLDRTLDPIPMFPFFFATGALGLVAESAGQWSPYGAVLDARMFGGDAVDQKPAAAADAGDEKAAVVEELPTKLEQYDLVIPINAAVKYIDFEGVSDGKSLRTIIKAVQPRSCIFVRGTQGALDEMKRFALQELGVKRVSTPGVEQTVDATSETQMYRAWISDALRAALRWQVIEDSDIAHVSSAVQAVQRMDGAEYRVLQSADPPLDMDCTSDAEDADEAPSHRTVFVGAPALKDLRTLLDRRGFRCEFSQGALIVNEVIIVRKENTPDGPALRVEGAFNPDYFVVRDICYSQFKMV